MVSDPMDAPYGTDLGRAIKSLFSHFLKGATSCFERESRTWFLGAGEYGQCASERAVRDDA